MSEMPRKVINEVTGVDGTVTRELVVGGELVGRHIRYDDGTTDVATFVDYLTTSEIENIIK